MIDLDSLRGIVSRATGTDWQAAYRQDVEALVAEVERLRAIVADQQMMLDEHRMDNQHAYEEGGHAERGAVVEWLCSKFEHWEKLVEWNRPNVENRYELHIQLQLWHDIRASIERGEHRREEETP